MKNNNKVSPEKLRDYFYDRCSAEEEIGLQRWFVENSRSTEAERLLDDLFDEVQVTNPTQAQNAFLKFCAKIGYRPAITQHSRIKTFAKWTQRIAAVLIVPLVIALSALYMQNRNMPEWQEMIVPAGERGELVLSDGTHLWLNSGSRVTYPGKFEGKQRKIFIDGEVYAQVEHNPKRPFIISAGDVEVKVLGTTFNMRAYNTDSSVEVALIEGSVLFDVNNAKCVQQVLMSRSEVVQYDRRTGLLEKASFQSESYNARARGGGFYFFNESLDNITTQLSRCFDKKIIITDPSLAKVEFYAFFSHNDSLQKILNTFNVDSMMNIQEKEEVIYISRRK